MTITVEMVSIDRIEVRSCWWSTWLKWAWVINSRCFRKPPVVLSTYPRIYCMNNDVPASGTARMTLATWVVSRWTTEDSSSLYVTDTYQTHRAFMVERDGRHFLWLTTVSDPRQPLTCGPYHCLWKEFYIQIEICHEASHSHTKNKHSQSRTKGYL